VAQLASKVPDCSSCFLVVGIVQALTLDTLQAGRKGGREGGNLKDGGTDGEIEGGGGGGGGREREQGSTVRTLNSFRIPGVVIPASCSLQEGAGPTAHRRIRRTGSPGASLP
jgi:hypothetical protein